MAIGDLLCGFTQTAGQFYAFRSMAEIGGRGINILVMIVVSDIIKLQNRGKYQGKHALFLLCDYYSYLRNRYTGSYYCPLLIEAHF